MKEVSLNVQDIKYLIDYLSVKAKCYEQAYLNPAQELDYVYCLDLIKRLKYYIND